MTIEQAIARIQERLDYRRLELTEYTQQTYNDPNNLYNPHYIIISSVYVKAYEDALVCIEKVSPEKRENKMLGSAREVIEALLNGDRNLDTVLEAEKLVEAIDQNLNWKDTNDDY